MNFKSFEKKKLKMQHFQKCIKKSIVSKISFFLCFFFKSDRPVCNHLNVNFIKTILKTIFLKNSILAFLTLKTLK